MLVVGAGPVGLLAALRLRQQGVQVRIIDQQTEWRAHTFPVLLHPQTLRLLQASGISAALFWRGRPVTRLAVYTEYERRAVLDFPDLPGMPAGLLTLPQDVLRQALSNALSQHGVEIEWNTRLAMLQQDGDAVWGRLLREDPCSLHGGNAAASAFEADYVIGADGYESMVREALGIELEAVGAVCSYAFFDATTLRSGSEAQLALSDDYGNSAYPMQGGQTRFSFQLGGGLNKPADAGALNELIHARMPWFGDEITSCDWGGVAEFRRALVTHFGSERIWLAGEAAHLTGPLGVHSVNVGLDEADELARGIACALNDSSQPHFGTHYDARRQRQWRVLLGLDEQARVTARSPDWTRRHLSQLTSALPGSERDLDDLFTQLRLLPSTPPARPPAPSKA